MELIYVYVDEYKNISNRELKLSSFYNIHKDRWKFEVTKTGVAKNFYSNNIDIVALFGKNGTGKSTTLELLAKILSHEYVHTNWYEYNPNLVPVHDIDMVAIFEENERVYYYSSFNHDVNVNCSFFDPMELSIEDLFLEKRNIVKFSHVIEPLAEKEKIKNNKYFKYIDCSNSGLIGRTIRSDQKNKDISSTFDLLKNHPISLIGDAVAPMVGIVDVTKDIKTCCKKISRKMSSFIANVEIQPDYYDVTIADKVRMVLLEVLYKYDVNDRISKSDFSDYPPFDGRDHLISIYESMIGVFNNPEIFYLNDKASEWLNHIFKFNLFSDIFTYMIDENKELDTINDCIIYFFDIVLHNKSVKLIDVVRDCENYQWVPFGVENIQKYREIESDNYNIWQLSNFIDQQTNNVDNQLIKFYVDEYDELVGINEILNKYKYFFSGWTIRWNGISSGQYSLLNMFSRLNEFLQFDEVNYVFIDEGEVYLHPEWQRNYIAQLVDFYRKILPDNVKVKIVMTSHSPMVLSDLPKESTNFLDIDNSSGSSFFGANLYDLYSDGFTVEKTMGEFAFQKIKLLTDDIKLGGNKSELQSRIEMLGDSFIKQVLMESLEQND